MTVRFALPLAIYGCCAALGATAARAGDVVITLDPARSAVTWELGAVLHTVHGTFTLQHGSIGFDRANPGKAAGEVAIDLTSGQSGNAKRDGRMQNEVLETPKFPSAVFTAQRVSGRLVTDAPSQLDVSGSLLIHGDRHPLTLHVMVTGSAAGRRVQTHFVIPYVAWGLKDPSTFVLRVNDYVDVDVDAAATERSATPQ